MKRSFISFCGMFFIAFLFMATSAKAENPILGSWLFNASQAPWEYSKGKVIFTQEEGKDIMGKIVFDSGIELRIANITRKEEKITFEAYVEGYPVRTIVDLKDDDMSGHVETPDGNLPFAAKREQPEE